MCSVSAPPGGGGREAPVRGLIHALPIEDPERALYAIPSDQTLEISVLAPCVAQQRAVWAGLIREDRGLSQVEEVQLPPLEPTAKDPEGFVERKGLPE